jgi:hypothetical protein
MKVVAIVDEEMHMKALAAARHIGTTQVLSTHGLNAVQVDEVMEWVIGLWDPIEAAISKACQQGMEAARPLVLQVQADLATLCNNASERARQVRAVLVERLNTYLMQVIDGALSRIRDHVTVGAKKFTISSITVDQKVSVSSSLKMSLSEICEFVAEGEIAVSAEYSQV